MPGCWARTLNGSKGAVLHERRPWSCTVDLCSGTGHPAPRPCRTFPPLAAQSSTGQGQANPGKPSFFLWPQGQDNVTTPSTCAGLPQLRGHTHSATEMFFPG